MSLGAAVGGFAQGLAGGLKLKSDLQDSEQRRGLMALQQQNAQIDIDTKQQLKDLNTKLFEESQAWQSGTGAYAPQEGMTYDAGSDEAARLHYSRIQPLLERQASLTGKNIMDVRKAIGDLEQNRYAQKLWRASRLIQAGDEGGIELLKDPYNRLFKDGRSLQGGSYDPDTDTFTLRYQDRDGNVKTSPPVKREKMAQDYALDALNTGDAVKLDVQQRESARDRAFRGDQEDKNRGLRRELTDKEIDSREREGAANRSNQMGIASMEERGRNSRNSATLANNLTVANINSDARTRAKVEGREDRDYDDFQKQINDALGWNKNNMLATGEDLSRRNAAASAMTQIFDTTRSVAGRKLSAYEAAQVYKGIQDKTAKYTQKDGYTIVDVGGIRAVLPAAK